MRKANATGYSADPNFLDAKRQLTTSKTPDAINTNTQLELIKQKIKNAYLSILLETDEVGDAHKVISIIERINENATA